jgi:hypothetical protein
MKSQPGSAAPARSRLTIGELFPHDDRVAQWVFSLTAFTEDLLVGIHPTKEARDGGDLRGLLFWHRHMVTRLYEAGRLIKAARDVAEVQEFVGDLLQTPPAGTDLMAAYTRPSKTTKSLVEQMYAQLRHMDGALLEGGRRRA